MRLTALVVVAVLLWPASVFSQDELAGLVGGVTGKTLVERCAEPTGTAKRNFCIGYIAGAVDTFLSYAHQMHRKSELCVPAGVFESVDAVVNYLRAHPEEQKYSASSETYLALKGAFSCGTPSDNPQAKPSADTEAKPPANAQAKPPADEQAKPPAVGH